MDNDDTANCITTELEPKDKWRIGISLFLGAILVIIGVDQLTFTHLIVPSIHLVYICFSLALILVYVVHWLRHDCVATLTRLEDPSEVRSYLTEARNIRPRNDDDITTEEWERKLESLKAEATKLEKLGCYKWTEYEALYIKQMIVDFLPLEDLKTRLHSVQLELKEYSEDSSYRYDQEYYATWQERISKASENLKSEGPTKKEAEEELRALLRSLYDHVADYNMNWAQGRTVIRDLMICGTISVPVFLIMAVTPVLHISGSHVLGVLHWGLLGVSGALTAVLLSLQQSDLVEVGNTEGRKELWRAILGTVLGLVAGILVFGLIGGNLLEGTAVPEVPCDAILSECDTRSTDKIRNFGVSDIALTLVWGIAAGFSFERVFERVRSSTIANP